MKTYWIFAGLLLVSLGAAAPATTAPATTSCDQDCRDTRSRAEREADAAEIRRLNNEQAHHVQQRDAQYAEGRERYDRYPQQAAQYNREREQYERERAQYEADMAEYRRRVELCRQGYRRYCQ